MRILTWNINSVRLRLPQLLAVLEQAQPDIVCLQETKVPDPQFPHEALAKAGYPHRVDRGMKNYNGVAILAKQPLSEPTELGWVGQDDKRHIAVTVETGMGPVRLHNFYVPSGGDVPDAESNPKFKHKLDFVDEMAAYWAGGGLDDRPAVIVGDFNIAPLPTDVWSHKQLLNVICHTPVETEKLTAMQQAGSFTDAVRTVYPPEDKRYTWWSYRNRTWPGSDRGRRLDHIWVTPSLADRIATGEVMRPVRGWEKPSDHVPVWVDLAVES